MNPFSVLFLEIVERPILNLLLVLIALLWGNLWWAIIILTLVVRLLLLPITGWSNDMQKGMSDMQPKLNELQTKYKDDPDTLSKETLKLFKTQWAWPLKWCIGLIAQLPIFIGLYRTILWFADWKVSWEWIYSFAQSRLTPFLNIATTDHMWLWIDLLQKNNWPLTIIAWILILVQTQITQLMQSTQPTVAQKWPNGEELPDMKGMMKYMNIFMVFMMWSFVYQVQAWVGLYILTTTLFGVLQMWRQYRELVKVELWVLKMKLMWK